MVPPPKALSPSFNHGGWNQEFSGAGGVAEYGSFNYGGNQQPPQDYVDSPVDSSGIVPFGRVIVEGYWFSRSGNGDDHPLVLDDVGGSPLVTSDDMRFDGEVGTQISFEFGRFYFGYMSSLDSRIKIDSQSNPADIDWFDSRAADPSDTYFTIYDSDFDLGDIGLRHQTSVGTDWYFGFAMGRLEENLDILSELDSNSRNGFFAHTINEFYGAHLGVRKQLHMNRNFRIEGTARGGLYFNDMEVNAVARDFDGYWFDEGVAYSGLGNISVVIPAWPINFRIGYQLLLLGGVATPQGASSTLDSFDLAAGEIETDTVLYHGLTFGVEKLW